MKTIAFVILPQVHILDLAGPLQVFYEAKNDYQQPFDLQQVALAPEVSMAQGLTLSHLVPYTTLNLQKGDYIIIAGIHTSGFRSEIYRQASSAFFDWLNAQHAQGVKICSVCTGAFVLAQAGLLDGKKCTTHWKASQELHDKFPAAKVQSDCLYIKDQQVYTSAGVASGIDLALSILEEEAGALLAAKVAREIVVYMRRNGLEQQQSIYLDYRTHLYEGVHRVQDWLVQNPEKKNNLEELAEMAHMSSRNLTRLFRKATGVSVHEFATKIRLELAKKLLKNPDLTIEAVAARCGFKDARQLRRLWREQFAQSPLEWRRGELV
ncbi:GlxA family transcriptional regulator [uncultured Microscilla sp.]|uniref:GlxA family transcriptional regulator n=1 Tax=uncultured Microscilla sp. TaxID=432653 RepID=UPI002628377E|nr:helix-turn-helix domain-containing protein [uncultured Microscilla sp.]